MSTRALAAAFRATTYRVWTSEAIFDLRIGIPNPAFDVFLARQNPGLAGTGPSRPCWAIITAHNPGERRAEAENEVHQQRLRERLLVLGWPAFPACNLADGDQWPAEPGFLLIGVRAEEVRALAGEFGQLAITSGQLGSPPRLVWVKQGP